MGQLQTTLCISKWYCNHYNFNRFKRIKIVVLIYVWYNFIYIWNKQILNNCIQKYDSVLLRKELRKTGEMYSYKLPNPKTVHWSTGVHWINSPSMMSFHYV